MLDSDGPKFAQALEQHVRQYNVDIMNGQRATALIRADPSTNVPGGLVQVKLANGAVMKARSLILSTGARWREVSVPGEQQYRNKGVA